MISVGGVHDFQKFTKLRFSKLSKRLFKTFKTFKSPLHFLKIFAGYGVIHTRKFSAPGDILVTVVLEVAILAEFQGVISG